MIGAKQKIAPPKLDDISRPGIYANVPMWAYLALNAASAHRLMDMAKSPAHCREAIDNPDEPTEDMRIGTACHLGILSPESLKSSYVVALICAAKLKSGKNAGQQCENNGKALIGGQWFCLSHATGPSDVLPLGAEQLTSDQWNIVVGASRAVREHPTVERLLHSTDADDRELTIVWNDEETGLLCKARIDCLIRPGKFPGIIYDLKSTTDACEEAFLPEAKRRKYWVQAAFYLRACQVAGIEADKFYLVPFEKEPPLGVGLVEVGDDLIAAGHALCRVMLNRYAKCKESGNWPGYPLEPSILELDEWTKRRVERLAEI